MGYIIQGTSSVATDTANLKSALANSTNTTFYIDGLLSLNEDIELSNKNKITTASNGQIYTNKKIVVNTGSSISNLYIEGTDLTNQRLIELVGENQEITNNVIKGYYCVVAPNQVKNATIKDNDIYINEQTGYGILMVNGKANKILDNKIESSMSVYDRWGTWGIAMNIASADNVIKNNVIDGKNKMAVGISVFNGTGEKNQNEIFCYNNIVDGNTVKNVTDEGIGIDFLLESDFKNTVNGFIQGTADVVNLEAGTNRTIIVCNAIKGMFETNSLNGKMCLLYDGEGSGQYSRIDFNDKTGGNFYLGTPLLNPIKAGIKFLIGNFAVGNKIINNSLFNCSRNGVTLYGACCSNLVDNNLVEQCGNSTEVYDSYDWSGIGCHSISYSGNPWGSKTETFAPNFNNKITNNTINSCKVGLEIKDAKSNTVSLGRPYGNIELNNSINNCVTEKIIDQELSEEIISQTKTGWIDPDLFKGEDYEKLEQAIQKAVEDNIQVGISRYYDITGHTVMVNIPWSKKADKPYIMGLGGGIIKNDSGFFFSSNEIAYGMVFENLYFKGIAGQGGKVFDGDKLFWVTSDKNNYKDVDSIIANEDTSKGYIQCFRSTNDIIRGGNLPAIDMFGCYDVTIDNISIEDRVGGGIVNTCQDGNTFSICTNLRILNSVIEANGGVGVQVQDCMEVEISNTFFEANAGGHIVIGDTDRYIRGIKINNNVCGDSAKTGYDGVFIKWAGLINSAISELNNTVYIKLHDTTDITSGYVDSIDDIGGTTQSIDPEERLFIKKNEVKWGTSSDDWSMSYMYFGAFKKITLTKEVTFTNGKIELTADCGEIINKDSIIGIQINNADIQINNKIVKSSNRNQLVMYLTNTNPSDVTAYVYVTILKFAYSTMG